MGSALPEVAQKSISIAGLRTAARHTQGLLRIPPRLESAIAAFLDEVSTRELKESTVRLSKAARKAKLAAMGDDEDSFVNYQELLPTATPLKWQSKSHFRSDLFSKYKERDTAAYVAARMPAVYSAVYRVLQEVSRRLPDFKPSRVMDYGSGPGTAMWMAADLGDASE